MTSNEGPDRLYINKDDREDYARLLKDDSPLKGKENKDLFILAMSVGFVEGVRRELEKREGFILDKYLSVDDKAMIAAIAVNRKGDLNVLADKKTTYSIAEEYASGGVKLLKDRVFSGEHGTFAKKLEAEMVEIFDKKILSKLNERGSKD